MSGVELVYDGDCPNVGQARAQLRRAFEAAGLPPCWREWQRDRAGAPARIRGFGSPTILVDGRDIAPAASDAACCRLYAQPGGAMAAVPPVELIVAAIRSRTDVGRRWLGAGLWGPAVGIAALPSLACPACWPGYAALAGSLGMPFLWDVRFLLPATLLALALVVGLLAWRAPQRRGYGPALLALAAGAAVVVAKFTLSSNPAAYAGAGVLLAACLWNTWPRRLVAASRGRPGVGA